MRKGNGIKSKNIDKSRCKNKKIYFGFTFRLLIYVILFIILFCSAILILVNSLSFVESKNISYVENSLLDYKVYLKDNEFYDNKYLDKDMLYVASLIDDVVIDFNYNFSSDENVDLVFNYKIIGKLSIMDNDEKKTYFEKEYVLLNEKNYKVLNNNEYNFNEKIDIDYNYYNSIANNFRNTYGVDTYSKLVVYLVIEKNNMNNDDIIINNSSYMSIVIPLSQRSINIGMDYKEIDNSSYLISKSDVIVRNIIFVVISMVLVILSIIIFIKIIRFLNLIVVKKSNYDKYITKLLNEYDRLIVETSTCPIISGDNVIVIDKFQELLDVRDNLKMPIMYYVVNKHQKCYFYILHENKIYLCVVKAVDLDK